MKKVEVNYVAGSATVTYDEAQTDLKTIKAKVHECGYHCGGEMVPRHVCAPEDPPAEAPAITPGHMGHVAGVERVDSESPDETVIDLKAIKARVHEAVTTAAANSCPSTYASPGIRPPKGSDDATNGTVIDERRHPN